jgi:FdhD protein
MQAMEDAVRQVRSLRLETGGTATGTDELVGVPVEAQVCIDVERVETYTLLAVPVDREALAAGFLLTEGVIDDMDDLVSLAPCTDDPHVIRARLKNRLPRIDEPGRNLLIASSCGLCGAEDLDAKLASLPRVGDTLRVDASILRQVSGALPARQPWFARCGGTHAATISTSDGIAIASAEDTGRHNALDKAIGKCLLAGQSSRGKVVMLSGRVSLEMVSKCARAGIELVAAVSATTSLAIDVAERCGITLCAFVRETRATVFCHPHRVLPV